MSGHEDASDWPVELQALPPAVQAVLRLGAEVSDHTMRRRLGPLLQTPLTVQQLRCLTILVVEGRATPHALSAQLQVSPATMTGIADRLVRAGMVDPTPDSRDGRGRVLSPTAAGQHVVRELLASDVETDAAVLRGLSPEELSGLELALTGILRELRRG
jgi:DNA-binding MarR family transcriptional regulator